MNVSRYDQNDKYTTNRCSLNRQLASDPKSKTIKKCAQPDFNVKLCYTGIFQTDYSYG